MKPHGPALDAKPLVERWRSLLEHFRPVFTAPGWRRFALGLTALVCCVEQHTLTQSLVGLNLQDTWHAAEAFLEYGAWDLLALETALRRLIEQREAPRWGGYRPATVDDTVARRTSLHVWGVGLYAHRNDRNPHRPPLQRGHNWVIQGELVPGRPWMYLPTAGRLYRRQSTLAWGEPFATKTALAVQLLRQLDLVCPVPVLAIFDGGYARQTVVQPCVSPPPDTRPIAILTRPRRDACLYAPLPAVPPPRGRGGRPRKWGPRLPAPQAHAQWDAPWQAGRAWIYGQERSFRAKAVVCRWAVSGPDVPMVAYVFEVEGYAQPWFLITSARDLSPAQVVEAHAARFRQEDGIRDQKQRLGMEEGRAWTAAPIRRTFALQTLALSLLRLVQRQQDAARGPAEPGYPATPWNRHKHWASVLDIRRLFWQARAEFSRFAHGLLGKARKPARIAA